MFHAPTRGLIGYQGELLTDTRGTAVMNRLFHGYAPHKGEIPGRRTGVLISNATGEATAYSLFYLQERGAMMIDPQTRVYAGMVVGEHTRDNDLVVNIIQGKKLTNVRASGKDENVILTPPMRLTLERALSYIDDDELVEGDAQVDPPAQALARPQRAQEARAGAGGASRGGVRGLTLQQFDRRDVRRAIHRLRCRRRQSQIDVIDRAWQDRNRYRFLASKIPKILMAIIPPNSGSALDAEMRSHIFNSKR